MKSRRLPDPLSVAPPMHIRHIERLGDPPIHLRNKLADHLPGLRIAGRDRPITLDVLPVPKRAGVPLSQARSSINLDLPVRIVGRSRRRRNVGRRRRHLPLRQGGLRGSGKSADKRAQD